ncbi:hypothetical protein EPI10_007304 [Gossypium australe]|uniref:Uncharacterized protein n=1 Tax=Gossypium australe TaxID=47621 RepID=A0A5B6WTR4_9ROSI|nr:hypothetical protein EPI10_007304 [Gossypium australe]
MLQGLSFPIQLLCILLMWLRRRGLMACVIIVKSRGIGGRIIIDVWLGEAKTINTPLEQNQELTTAELSTYQRLMSRWLYLTNTWPDISCAVQHLSQFMRNPKKFHFEAALRIVQYIKKDPD